MTTRIKNHALKCANASTVERPLVRNTREYLWCSMTSVASAAEAAEVIEHHRYSRVFLTSGRSTVDAFAHLSAWFLIRVVIAPLSSALPIRHTLLLSRGPYRYHDELA